MKRALAFGLVLALLAIWFGTSQTRSREEITPGPSSGSSFEVKIVKPRLSRPLFGALPNVVEVVIAGGDPFLTSASPGFAIRSITQNRVEVRADGWDLVIHADDSGKIARATRVTFPIRLGDRDLTLRCRPADPAVGYLVAGRFRVALAECEDAASGKLLEWPPSPLIMEGRVHYDSRL